MRYRIVITTFKSGRKEYLPQVKKWIGWVTIGYNGCEGRFYAANNSREEALVRIDKHFTGNTTAQTIEFEYIAK